MRHLNLKSVTLFMAVALMFAACIKDNVPTPRPTPAPQVNRGQLVGVLDSASYSCSTFADAINESPIFSYFGERMASGSVISDLLAPSLKTLVKGREPVLDIMFRNRVGLDNQYRRQWQIESYVFTYSSVDAMGNPITLAGRVTFPNNTVSGTIHEVSSLSLASHQFLIQQSWAPSNSFSLLSMRCLYNSAVIEPDYQGYGYDNMKHVHTMLCTDVMGRQLMDCAMAAVALMKNHGVQLADDGKVTNWATSAGEAYALAFARYYDREATNLERATIPLHSTYVNDGMIDIAEFLVYQDRYPDLDIFFVQYMASVCAMPPSALHGYIAEQFYPEWMNTTMIDYMGETQSYIYWASRFANPYTVLSPNEPDPSTVRPYMGMRLSEDMLLEDGHVDFEAEKTRALMQILREQMTYDDWIPQTEIYMANEDEDLTAPYYLGYNVYTKLRQRSNHVHWLVIDNSMSPLRQYMDVHQVSSLESLLYMTLAPEPKDMCLIHREER